MLKNITDYLDKKAQELRGLSAKELEHECHQGQDSACQVCDIL